MKKCYDNVDKDICKNVTKEQEKYISKCLSLAQKSNLTQKHGCVLVRKKKIISCGYNFKMSNHFLDTTKKETTCRDIFSIHAEISTIKKVKKQDLSECDLYVVRLGPLSNIKDEKYSLKDTKYSCPCKVCKSFIVEYNIKRVYYTINP